MKHDTERYNAFLMEALAVTLENQAGHSLKGPTIKTGVLLPHEVTEQGRKAWTYLQDLKCNAQDTGNVERATLEHAEMLNLQCNLQWDGLVQTMKKAMAQGEGIGACVSVCDVSGSMSGLPMSVACALGLLLTAASSTDSEFYGKLITFETTPSLVTVFTPADSLTADNTAKLADIGLLVERTREMAWGGSTSLFSALQLYLDTCIAAETPVQEIEGTTLVIFSDMQFDEAEQGVSWETTHKSIVRMFETRMLKMPRLVYWNLRPKTVSSPIESSDTPGVLLLSGFSAGLLKSFLGNSLDTFTPGSQLKDALADIVYQELVVADEDE